MLDCRTDFHIFEECSDTRDHYCKEILLSYVRLFRDAVGPQFLFMDGNAKAYRISVEELLNGKAIELRLLDWQARSSDLNPIKHVRDLALILKFYLKILNILDH